MLKNAVIVLLVLALALVSVLYAGVVAQRDEFRSVAWRFGRTLSKGKGYANPQDEFENDRDRKEFMEHCGIPYRPRPEALTFPLGSVKAKERPGLVLPPAEVKPGLVLPPANRAKEGK